MLRALILLVPLLPTVAAAAEAHHGGHQGVPWAFLLFSFINFFVFIWVMQRFAWPAISDWVKERRLGVIKALEDAARAREAAEKLKLEWEQRVAGLGQELEAMRSQARSDMEREREAILNTARKAADAIREDARRLADQEVREARARLRQELARQAFEIACEITPQHVSAGDQARFVDEFLERVNP